MVSKFKPQYDPTFVIYSRLGKPSEQELSLKTLQTATEFFQNWINYPLNNVLNVSDKVQVVCLPETSSELLGAHGMIISR